MKQLDTSCGLQVPTAQATMKTTAKFLALLVGGVEVVAVTGEGFAVTGEGFAVALNLYDKKM
jgi:hypothetical protein